MTETKVTGKAYRILTDKANEAYDRISFWTHASDVEMSNGNNLETELNSTINSVAQLNTDLSALKADVRASGEGAHNAIYRGKNLGSSVTAAQWTAISNGTFEDLFIGDYWRINGVNWRIAGFNYWKSSSQNNTNHVVIVPDTVLTTSKMNNTNVTDGAYLGSDFYKGTNGVTGRSTAITAANNAFGSAHIFSHYEALPNATTDGYESSYSYVWATVELMNERMVFGADIMRNHLLGVNRVYNSTTSTSQLPLFRLNRTLVHINSYWWLRDVVSPYYFSSVRNLGAVSDTTAYNDFGIRPAFAIKA